MRERISWSLTVLTVELKTRPPVTSHLCSAWQVTTVLLLMVLLSTLITLVFFLLRAKVDCYLS